MIQHNKPDGTRCPVLGVKGQKCLRCGTVVGGSKPGDRIVEALSRQDLEPEPTTIVGRMQKDLRALMQKCTCGKAMSPGGGSCSSCKKAKALRLSIEGIQEACEHEEVEESPLDPFTGICKSCGAEDFVLVDEFDPLGRGPDHKPNRDDWKVAIAAMRLYLSNDDLVAELKRRGGGELELTGVGQHSGRYVRVPPGDWKAPERPPALDQPCPHPARSGNHELYVDPNKRGQGGKMLTVCHACGARGFV